MIYDLENLVDHPINFLGYSWPAPAVPARVEQKEDLFGDLLVRHPDAPGGALALPVSAQRFGEPVGLPAPVQGTMLLVSRITASAVRDWTLKRGLEPRRDLWVPGPFNKQTGQCGSVMYG